ncbi:MAG: AraC family transcriptional regulator ligand-binding domain-containing protein [Halioglobus sp.]
MPSLKNELPIPSTYARIIARILGLQERDLPDLLRGTGLPTDILMPGDETFITGQQQLTIMANGQRLMNTDTFGLRLGAELQPSSHGPLGYLALSSPDLLSSLRSLRDFLPVRLPIATFEIIQDKNYLSCVYRINLTAKEEVRRSMCECFILVIQSLVEAVIGRSVDEGITEFDYDPPDYGSDYALYIHSPYQFSCSRTAYSLPASLANVANVCGDTHAYQVAQDLCSKLLQQTPHTARSMSDRVRTLLLTQPPETVSEEKVARSMFVSKRTLARRLDAEHTSYRTIRDQVLLELAQRYLGESRQSVESVAGLLGYHDSAAFRKAFKRWTALTPSAYRTLQST